MGSVNWIGLWTLYRREVWRFLKVWNQTVVAPVVTTLLFLAIFMLAMGGEHRVVEGMPFHDFIAPGLIMMAVVQNAFANSSSSLMLSKIQGTIIDILMPPLSAGELTLAIVMGGVTRGVFVGVAVSLAVHVFVPLQVHDWGLVLFYMIASSMMLSLLGLVGGIWAQTFDQMSAITNYVVTPLAFLSGTFYSVKDLPGIWHSISQADPFFYMIDGFRYALTGYTDGHIGLGIVVMLGMNLVLWAVAHTVIAKGYGLKN
ncbi:MAG: ABC transporter permease [Alphaproteobacteria bacterium]|nr:ABC transporter permease [Alphaproteobacteria bacterium]